MLARQPLGRLRHVLFGSNEERKINSTARSAGRIGQRKFFLAYCFVERRTSGQCNCVGVEAWR